MSETEKKSGAVNAEAPEKEPTEPSTPATQADGDDEDEFHSRIIIKPNGEVVIENLSIDLMELLEMLDPDAEVSCALPEPEQPASETANASDNAIKDS